MNKTLEDMTEPELREVMTRAARAVERELPRGAGPRGRPLFTLLAWDDPKVAQYISNCDRPSMILALREAADRLEQKEDVTR